MYVILVNKHQDYINRKHFEKLQFRTSNKAGYSTRQMKSFYTFVISRLLVFLVAKN